MLVDGNDVVAYLLDRGLISKNDVISGDLHIVDNSRRNRVFLVARQHAPSYVLKQAVTDDACETLANEARILAHLNSVPSMGRLPSVPHLYEYDNSACILLSGLMASGRDLRQEFHAHRGFSVGLSRSLGRVLGTVHSLPIGGTAEVPSGVEFPWIWSSSAPSLTESSLWSEGSQRVIEMIQSVPDSCASMRALQGDWQQSHLVHQDLRWDNCIAYSAGTRTRRTRVVLIDWETSGLGDPAWDVACVLADFIAFWISSMPIAWDSDVDELPMAAEFPLSRMRPAILGFWSSYAQCVGLDLPGGQVFLGRVALYLGTRLFQVAFEQMQMRNDLTGNVVAMVQAGHNIIRRPDATCEDLLGIIL